MENVAQRDNGEQTRLMFGPEPCNGGTYMVARNGEAASDARAFIDHVCYTIPNWNEDDVRGGLAAHGLEVTGREGSLHVYDPFDFDIQIANAVEENPFR